MLHSIELLNWIEHNTTNDGYVDTNDLLNYINSEQYTGTKCRYYEERTIEKYLTSYEQGVIFGKTGKHVRSVEVACGYCTGQKCAPECSCQGDKNKCEIK